MGALDDDEAHNLTERSLDDDEAHNLTEGLQLSALLLGGAGCGAPAAPPAAGGAPAAEAGLLADLFLA